MYLGRDTLQFLGFCRSECGCYQLGFRDRALSIDDLDRDVYGDHSHDADL